MNLGYTKVHKKCNEKDIMNHTKFAIQTVQRKITHNYVQYIEFMKVKMFVNENTI